MPGYNFPSEMGMSHVSYIFEETVVGNNKASLGMSYVYTCICQCACIIKVCYFLLWMIKGNCLQISRCVPLGDHRIACKFTSCPLGSTLFKMAFMLVMGRVSVILSFLRLICST